MLDFNTLTNSIVFSSGGLNTFEINGLVYTLLYDSVTGISSVDVSGTATADTVAMEKTISVKKDNNQQDLLLIIPSVTVGATSNSVKVIPKLSNAKLYFISYPAIIGSADVGQFNGYIYSGIAPNKSYNIVINSLDSKGKPIRHVSTTPLSADTSESNGTVSNLTINAEGQISLTYTTGANGYSGHDKIKIYANDKHVLTFWTHVF